MTQQIKKIKEKTSKKQNKRKEQNELYKDLTNKIKIAFKGHVGEENYLTPHELFLRVYKLNPEEIGFYRASFLWSILKKFFHKLRKSNELFIINKGRKLFILKDYNELVFFKNRTDKSIKGLEEVIKRAEIWFNEEKFKEYE